MRTILIFGLCLIAIFSFGQKDNFSKAVLVDASRLTDTFSTYIHKNIIESIVDVNAKNVKIYNWNSKDHKVSFSTLNKEAEAPADVVIFLEGTSSLNLNPDLFINTDTLGKVISVSFKYYGYFYYKYKCIDAVTSKVLNNGVHEVVSDINREVKVSDFLKLFGEDPLILKKRNNNEFLKKEKLIKETYSETIKMSYIKGTAFSSEMSNLLKDASNKVLRTVLSTSQPAFNVVQKTSVNDKKIKLIEFNGGKKDNLVLNEYYDVMAKKDIEGYTYYDDVGTVSISKIGDTISEAKTVLFSGKEMTKSLNNNDELVMANFKNVFLLSQLSYRNDIPKVNIAIKKKCLFCLETLENTLIESPIISLVERNAPELNYFNDMTKNELYIDYSLEDLQGKKVGYDLLIDPLGKYVEVIEVKSYKTVASFKPIISVPSYQNVNLPKVSQPNLKIADLQRVLYEYNSELYKGKWVSTLETKKDKIEKILFYHPVGLDRYMEYYFYTLVTEEVDGEKVMRKNKIARGKIGKSYSFNLSELKIKNGEKELFQAKQENKEIIILVSDGTPY